jgi:hypothetical protein
MDKILSGILMEDKMPVHHKNASKEWWQAHLIKKMV